MLRTTRATPPMVEVGRPVPNPIGRRPVPARTSMFCIKRWHRPMCWRTNSPAVRASRHFLHLRCKIITAYVCDDDLTSDVGRIRPLSATRADAPRRSESCVHGGTVRHAVDPKVRWMAPRGQHLLLLEIRTPLSRSIRPPEPHVWVLTRILPGLLRAFPPPRAVRASWG